MLSARRMTVSLTALAVAAALVGLAGCRKTDDVGAPPTTAGATLISVRVGPGSSGGLTQEVSQDGIWAITDHDANTTERGVLEAADVVQLRSLVESPGLTEELLRTPRGCVGTDDTISVTVIVSSRSVSLLYCALTDYPKLTAVLQLLNDATPTVRVTLIHILRTGPEGSAEIVVAGDGSWEFADLATSTDRHRGKLTAADLARLRSLVRTPSFAEEMRVAAASKRICDDLRLIISTGGESADFTICDDPTAHPTVGSAIGVLGTATPLGTTPTPLKFPPYVDMTTRTPVPGTSS